MKDVYSVFILPRKKRMKSDTDSVWVRGENAVCFWDSVFSSSWERRCPERWLSFLSSKCRLNGNDIFKVPAEKIWVIQVRFTSINGKKAQSEILLGEREDSISWVAELLKPDLLQICFSSWFLQSPQQAFNNLSFPLIFPYIPTFSYSSLTSECYN